jgi:hypothetical protein
MERVDLRVLQRECVAPCRDDDIAAGLGRMGENARKTVEHALAELDRQDLPSKVRCASSTGSRKSLSQLSISTMRQRPAKAFAKRGTLAISRLRYQPGQPHQIVGGGSKGKSPYDPIPATEAALLLPGDRLDPAECLLDALADCAD